MATNPIPPDLAEALDAKFFQVFTEPVRHEILKFLFTNGPSDVGAIERHLPQDRSVISRHLDRMSAASVLKCEKQGRRRIYQIDGAALLEQFELIVAVLKPLIAKCCPEICCGEKK